MPMINEVIADQLLNPNTPPASPEHFTNKTKIPEITVLISYCMQCPAAVTPPDQSWSALSG